MSDSWDPAQYDRFKDERRAPFYDLLALVRPVPGGRVVDLGCGTGELTAYLHEQLGADETLGVDTSEAMLDKASAHATDRVRFELADLRDVDGTFDVVFANASLQWVPDHPALLRSLTAALSEGGQLAVQVPANVDHPSHVIAAEVAAEMIDDPPPDAVLGVLRPERYAELLYELGFDEQHVRLQVYGHVLPSSADVVEWVKGTSLTRFKAVMTDEQFDEFIERYRDRLVQTIGDRSPYFYAFKRVLFWAALP
jgi:trans-aconitate 2-methyltransferase